MDEQPDSNDETGSSGKSGEQGFAQKYWWVWALIIATMTGVWIMVAMNSGG